MTPRAVYVAALNRAGILADLGDALHREPYLRPPVAPILHLKPANTWIGPGDPIPCPPGVSHLRIGGTIGLVIGRTARRVSAEEALDHVTGLTLCHDVSIRYQSHYRPAIKQRCRDGFCPIGETAPLPAGLDPDRLEVTIEINGVVRSRSTGADLVRGAATLLAEVSRFITFEPGDLLLLGEPSDAPVAAPGDRVRITAPGIAPLENPILEAAP